MHGTRKSVVFVPGFYAKKRATILKRRKNNEPRRAVSTREPLNTVKPNMDSANHGNSPSVTNPEYTFHTGKHKVDHP